MANTPFDQPALFRKLQDDARRDGWNAAVEACARFMEARKVSASEFYGGELRKLRQEPPECTNQNSTGES